MHIHQTQILHQHSSKHLPTQADNKNHLIAKHFNTNTKRIYSKIDKSTSVIA